MAGLARGGPFLRAELSIVLDFRWQILATSFELFLVRSCHDGARERIRVVDSVMQAICRTPRGKRTMMTRFMLVCSLAFSCVAAFSCGGSDTKGPLKVGVMPKQILGNNFFNAVETGVDEAGRELGVTVSWDGPDTADVTGQIPVVEKWVKAKYDAIAVSSADGTAIAPSLRAARIAGVKVITWDADADARDFFVNQAPVEGVAEGLMDTTEAAIGPTGQYVIITAKVDSPNQNAWIDAMLAYQKAKYPLMTNLTENYSTAHAMPMNDDYPTGLTIAGLALDTYCAAALAPNCTAGHPIGIIAPTTGGVQAAAEILQERNTPTKVLDVFITGLGLPNDMRPYIKNGTVTTILFWNPVDLGYLVVQVAKAAVDGTLQVGDQSYPAGRLNNVQVDGNQVILGVPFAFDSSNIDSYNF